MILPNTSEEWMPDFLKQLNAMATGHEPVAEGFKGLSNEAKGAIDRLSGLARDCRILCDMSPQRAAQYINQRNQILIEKLTPLFNRYTKKMEAVKK